MRSRLLTAVPLVMVAALALAGCATTTPTEPVNSTQPAQSAEPDQPAADPAADMCAAEYPGGSTVDKITVVGDFETEPTLTLEGPLGVTDIQRKVVIEGTGDEIKYGDSVEIAQTIFDAETGAKINDLGWTTPMQAQSIVAETGMAQVIGCVNIGSRVVATTPGSDQRPAYVWVFDVRKIAPTAAWGTPQEPVAGMPLVTLDESGKPAVTIPDAEAPKEFQMATLKEGDAAVVGVGDMVTLQYMGIKWSDGSEFDSSWSRGAPSSFPTTGVVEGFKRALEGHAVGSQVLVVIPPELGYGGQAGHELENETLVFVVDILGTAPAN